MFYRFGQVQNRWQGIGHWLVLAIGLMVISHVANDAAAATDMAAQVQSLTNRLATAENGISKKSSAAKLHLSAAKMALNCAEEAEREKVGVAGTLLELASKQLAIAEQTGKSGAAGPGVLAIEHDELVLFINDQVGLLFKVTDKVADLRAIYHVANDHQFLRWMIGTRPMWEIGTIGGSKWGPVFNSTEPAPLTKVVNQDDKGVELKLAWQRDEPTVNVTVTCKLAAGDNLSHWTIDVDGKDDKLGIAEVAFPLVRGIGKTEKQSHDFLAYPHKSGWLYVDPGKRANFAEHPRMQFMGYYTDDNSGLYIGTHDPTGNTKKVEALADSGTLAASFIYQLAYANVPGHRTQLPAVLGVYDGDWYDATQVYRKWAHNQKWCPKFPLNDERSEIPDWFKRLCVTLRCGAEDDPPKMEKQLDYAIKAKQFFGVPTMCNWYGFFDTQGANHVCAYAPYWADFALPNAAAVFKRGKDAGMRQVGYSLVKCYDTRLPQYKTIGKPAQRIDLKGDVIWSRYGNQPLVSVCYSHKGYQDEFAKEMSRHAGELGLDGTYSDLAATNIGESCYNPDHDHAPGYGTLMIDSQRELLDKKRKGGRQYNPDFIVMLESPDETLFNVADTYLTFQGFFPGDNRNIPMIQAVYGEFIRSYGCKGAGIRNTPKEAVEVAMNWTYGGAMGRLFIPRNDQEANWGASTAHRYRRRVARLRHAAIDHLGMGLMRRPLKIAVENSPVSDIQQMDFSVETATWQAKDRTVAFAISNTRVSKELAISYTIDPAEYGIPADGSWALYKRDEDAKDTAIALFKGPLDRAYTIKAIEPELYIAKPYDGSKLTAQVNVEQTTAPTEPTVAQAQTPEKAKAQASQKTKNNEQEQPKPPTDEQMQLNRGNRVGW